MSEFNTTAVLPGIDTSELQTPSQYSTQRLQSTAGHAATQRKPSSPTKAPRIIEFMDISELSNHKTAFLDVDTPLFRPTPSEVIQTPSPFPPRSLPRPLHVIPTSG